VGSESEAGGASNPRPTDFRSAVLGDSGGLALILAAQCFWMHDVTNYAGYFLPFLGLIRRIMVESRVGDSWDNGASHSTTVSPSKVSTSSTRRHPASRLRSPRSTPTHRYFAEWQLPRCQRSVDHRAHRFGPYSSFIVLTPIRIRCVYVMLSKEAN
jgi:hypothetical protein